MAIEAIPITKRVEIIDKREFAIAILKADNEIFMMYITALAKSIIMLIHPFCQAQVASLTSEKTRIFAEYSDFFNVFSSDSVVKLLESLKINDHRIDLLNDKQLLYNSIYSLRPVKLETLKNYIKANLASSFNKSSKSPSSILILFVQKKDGSLRFYVNY